MQRTSGDAHLHALHVQAREVLLRRAQVLVALQRRARVEAPAGLEIKAELLLGARGR
jgi:hypothetical protein